MKHLLPLFAFIALLIPTTASSQLPFGFVQYKIADELNPTDMAIAPNGLVFITEKNGTIRLVEDGKMLPDPFMELVVDDYNECGLGHITLHPDYPDSPFVYLYYTVPGGTYNRVSRVRSQGYYVVPGSEEVLYECDVKVSSVHHGGAMVFGNDGKLYVAIGENGSINPPNDPNNDSGKILRLNPDGSIPDDNPFYEIVDGKYKSVFATGLRNPFSMAVQPETGRIFLCDVGTDVWEEINEVLPGKDYGFPTVEGKKGDAPMPDNYQDPLYAYHHVFGCAAVGAAFYPMTGGNFPDKYKGRFFFADYCASYIGVLNPLNGQREQNLLTNASRPVSIRISPQGDFYYLARAGIGGGSEEDNTASSNGSIWRIAYTGSNAPFVYSHPKGGLYTVGDTVRFEVLALGQKPLEYQWQKNGKPLFGEVSNTLILENVQLQDSASAYRCIVSNSISSDTSAAALLRVTTNTRPIPVITLPETKFLYRAGEEIPFSGYADDAEEGLLSPTALTWKIDFHHDNHTHPAIQPTNGLTEGSYIVSDEGEPSDNVWYRVYLTAKDSMGLSNTLWKDVFPHKSEITVATGLSDIEVNVDGLKGLSPYTFLSVVGMQRNATVPVIQFKGDSILLFNQWHNGDKHTTLSFVTPEENGTLIEAEYKTHLRSNGKGLYGEYFKINDYYAGFDGELLLTRIDTTIFFEWGIESPAAGYVPDDFFAVRWTGDIVPFFDDTLTFYTFTDDGVRLWVNDTLLIDQWTNQPKTEHSGAIFLEGGQRYPIRMEYFEASGGATAHLSWGSSRLPKDIVPKSQLHPPKGQVLNKISGFVWLDSLQNNMVDNSEPFLEKAAVVLLDKANNVAGAATTDAQGRYEIAHLPSGQYQLYILPPLTGQTLLPSFGLDEAGYSDTFILKEGEHIERNFAFALKQTLLPDASSPRSWSISPNPSKGIFTFKKHPAHGTSAMDIKVFSRRGKLILEKRLNANELEAILDLTGASNGVYSVMADGFRARIVVVR